MLETLLLPIVFPESTPSDTRVGPIKSNPAITTASRHLYCLLWPLANRGPAPTVTNRIAALGALLGGMGSLSPDGMELKKKKKWFWSFWDLDLLRLLFYVTVFIVGAGG